MFQSIKFAGLTAVAAFSAMTMMPQAAAAQTPVCVPVISQAVVRVPPGKPKMMAGYFRLDNPCRKAVVLNAARSAKFGEVSIHETVERDGMARMRYVPSLVIAAGDRVLFQPGGLHLMMMKPRAAVAIGTRIPVRLSGPGWSQQVLFEVRGMSAD